MVSDVDPRFDPAFQRGFDGAPPSPAHPRVEPATPLVERVESSAPPTPLVERVETSAPQTPLVERVESSAPPTPLVERVETSAPARNPWIPVLWITAALFTIAGLATQYLAARITLSPTADTPAIEYVIPEVFTALSPVLFAAGLATAIATLVILALRWQPRP